MDSIGIVRNIFDEADLGTNPAIVLKHNATNIHLEMDGSLLIKGSEQHST